MDGFLFFSDALKDIKLIKLSPKRVLVMSFSSHTSPEVASFQSYILQGTELLFFLHPSWLKKEKQWGKHSGVILRVTTPRLRGRESPGLQVWRRAEGQDGGVVEWGEAASLPCFLAGAKTLSRPETSFKVLCISG